MYSYEHIKISMIKCSEDILTKLLALGSELDRTKEENNFGQGEVQLFLGGIIIKARLSLF